MKEILSCIILIGFALFVLVWIAMVIWWIRPYKALKWLCHDILEWHKPDNTYYFDGCSDHSHCRICGKEIMMDSQGNWFLCGHVSKEENDIAC